MKRKIVAWSRSSPSHSRVAIPNPPLGITTVASRQDSSLPPHDLPERRGVTRRRGSNRTDRLITLNLAANPVPTANGPDGLPGTCRVHALGCVPCHRVTDQLSTWWCFGFALLVGCTPVHEV